MKYILIILLFVYSCTKKEYIIEKPDSLTDTLAPEEFNIAISEITDHSAIIQWESSTDANGGKVKYDIAINDSVIAYDLENRSYFIKDLSENTKYKVSVYAIDPYLNSTHVSSEFQTMKSFVQAVIEYGSEFEFFSFDYAIETSDKGLLIGGRITETLTSDPYRTYIMKLNASYDVEWIKIFNIGGEVKNLLESISGNYLIVLDACVYKLDNNGSQLWIYKNPESGNYPSLDCAIEDMDGNFIIAGYTSKNLSADVNLPYTLIKLSSSGEEIWFKYGGTTLYNRPHDIMLDQNHNLLIFGTAEFKGTKPDHLSDAEESFWLLWCNSEGEFIDQKFYPSQTNESDMAGKIKLTPDQNYLLLGTATGGWPPYGYYGFRPRFLKVTQEGDVIWDRNYNLNSGGINANFVDSKILENDRNLILTNDDRGIAISIINGLGELEKHIQLYGYPPGKLIRFDVEGNYHYVTVDGRIIILNHDGYIE